MKKRILAALLSAVMVFTMIPFMGVTAYAENTKGPEDEYVSLPITIRDYAADGMLFECNEEKTQGRRTLGQPWYSLRCVLQRSLAAVRLVQASRQGLCGTRQPAMAPI